MALHTVAVMQVLVVPVVVALTVAVSTAVAVHTVAVVAAGNMCCHTTASTKESSARSQSCKGAEASKPSRVNNCVAGLFVVAMMA